LKINLKEKKMGILNVLGLVSGILPLVSNTVHAVEGIFGHGTGVQKKAAVQAAISDVLNIANTVAGKTEISSDSSAALSQLIDAMVTFFNATGIFTHATASQTKS
jgi:uncharacterized membrane protein